MSFSLPSARARHAHEVVALAVGRGALAKREPRRVVAIRHKVVALPVSRVRSPEGHASAGENVPKPWVGSRLCSSGTPCLRPALAPREGDVFPDTESYRSAQASPDTRQPDSSFRKVIVMMPGKLAGLPALMYESTTGATR